MQRKRRRRGPSHLPDRVRTHVSAQDRKESKARVFEAGCAPDADTFAETDVLEVEEEVSTEDSLALNVIWQAAIRMNGICKTRKGEEMNTGMMCNSASRMRGGETERRRRL